MHQVSSNLTLILKIFLPTFWLAFFGLFTVTTFVGDSQYFGNIPVFLFRLGAIVFYLIGSLILYLTLMRLKRVEMSNESVYTSNYFKAFKYSWDSIAKIKEHDLWFMSLVRIHLKEPGSFGKRIPFLASRKRLQAFLVQHPEIVEQFVENENSDKES